MKYNVEIMDQKTLWKISYGMYVVCSKNEKKLNGQIANTVFQITADPAQIAISISKQNYTHDCLAASKKFAVSILTEDTPMKLIGTFGFKSGKDINKFEGINFKLNSAGIPILSDFSAGFLEADIINQIDAGTHTIYIGLVTGAETQSDNPPMTYDYYHKVKQGLTPKNAATYQGGN